MMTAEIIAFSIITSLAVISPGPDFAVVTRNSLFYSRRAGAFTALGISLGLSVHVVYTLLGIGFVISRSILLFSLIKYIGAGYLIYLGVKSLLSKKEKGPKDDGIFSKNEELSDLGALRMGLLTNVLNPKATFFFLSVFTQVINPKTPYFIQSLLGLEVMVIALVWFTVLAVLFSHKIVKRRVASFGYYLSKIMGGALVLLGLRLAFSRAK